MYSGCLFFDVLLKLTGGRKGWGRCIRKTFERSNETFIQVTNKYSNIPAYEK